MFDLARNFLDLKRQHLGWAFPRYMFNQGKMGSRFSEEIDSRNSFWVGVFVIDQSNWCTIGRIHFLSVDGKTFKFSHVHPYSGSRSDPTWDQFEAFCRGLWWQVRPVAICHFILRSTLVFLRHTIS
jgi:hypothetical protein